MELFRILQRKIPKKNIIFDMFHKNERQDISKFILQTIKTVKKETKNIRMTNSFCSELYDMIYHHVIFRRVKIVKKVLRGLESLALPTKHIGEERWNESFKKMKSIRL
ncbi:MAG: hypothetical protein WCJ45_07270 [bacterium]